MNNDFIFKSNEVGPASETVGARKLSVREAAHYLRVSKGFLDKKRSDGSGPQFLKLGRRVVYDALDLEEWVSSTRRRHTGV